MSNKTTFILFGILLTLAFMAETSVKAFDFYMDKCHQDVMDGLKVALKAILAFSITCGSYIWNGTKYIYSERNNIKSTIEEAFVYRSPSMA